MTVNSTNTDFTNDLECIRQNENMLNFLENK